MNMQDNNHVLYVLVKKLCESFIPAKHDNFNKICQYSLDLITQKKLKIEASEEQYLLAKIRENFFRDGNFQESTRFDDLYHTLKMFPYKNVNIGELIYCLFLLSNSQEDPQQASILAMTNNLQRLQMPENDYESIDLNAHYSAQPGSRFAPDVTLRRNGFGSMASLVPHASRPHTIHGEPGPGYDVVNKHNLLAMDLVNIFQGLPGKYINFSQNEKFTFHIERIAEFAANDVFLAKRLSVIGQHFKTIRNCASMASGNTSKGFVFQSFGSALEEQQFDFYKLMTSIQANFHKNSTSSVTMHKLTIWVYETAIKFEALANLTTKCKSKRGGALVAVIYDFMNHGDPIVRESVKAILSKVLKPLRQMLNHWIFFGELKDDFREFFICVNDTQTVVGNDFWRDKYIINKLMLPGFISKDQAYKILITGKAISMLREVESKVAIFLPVYDQLKTSFENSNLETLFAKRGVVNQSNDFAHLLDYLYKEISHAALNILNEKYTLHGHFYAHKRYLLFEQGDFISYLVEVLNPFTNIAASKLKIYTLSQRLEQSIMKSNARWERPEILSHLDMQISQSRNMFTLKYKADGPLSTIFSEQTQILYAKIFDLLWTIKRFHFNLQNYWIQLRMMFKSIQALPPTFKSISNNFNFILYQIVKFVGTVEFYFSSTIETKWLGVKSELDTPHSLDRLIKSHQLFLQAIDKGLFFSHSTELTSEFDKVCDQIWEFFHKLDEFITPIQTMAQTADSTWVDELQECYKQYDCEYPIWLVNFSKTFNYTIVNFLENLVETEEQDLQELCFCIDFNGFYKRTILAN